jgi:hypothetical protein
MAELGVSCSEPGLEDGSTLAPGPVSEILAPLADDVDDVEVDRRCEGRLAGPTVGSASGWLELGASPDGDHHLAGKQDVAEAREGWRSGSLRVQSFPRTTGRPARAQDLSSPPVRLRGCSLLPPAGRRWMSGALGVRGGHCLYQSGRPPGRSGQSWWPGRRTSWTSTSARPGWSICAIGCLAAARIPVTFIAFEVVHLVGQDLRGCRSSNGSGPSLHLIGPGPPRAGTLVSVTPWSRSAPSLDTKTSR